MVRNPQNCISLDDVSFQILAWMETVAVNFHDESGDFLRNLKFEAGDDAIGIKWLDVDENSDIFTGHYRLIKATAMLRNAHF